MKFVNDCNYLDQHFLIDKSIINKYIEFANIKKSDIILEIGPGTGTLTKLIKDKCQKLIVVEKDERLRRTLENIKGIEVIIANVLDIDIPKVDKIITSIPYSIIEPFMQKLINCDFKEMIMLMGSHYIDSVLNRNVNRLSIITNCYFKVEKLLTVEPTAFDYPPKTGSYIVRVTKIDMDNLSYKDKIYRYLYYYQNKLIRNALRDTLIKLNNLTKNNARKIIAYLNIPLNILENKFATISNQELEVLDKNLELLNKINFDKIEN